MQNSHQDYMLLALQLAEQGRYSVSPNPMVGCVLVKNHSIIGQGFHQRAGYAHAEINALQQAGTEAQGATAYVNLEPCCHTGKTPPCTEALIKAGIKKIYIASLDPNPLVAGGGVAALEKAGIEVEVGLLQEKAQQLNEIFFHYMTTQRPFVILKWAMSLDGKTVAHPSDSAQISNAISQQKVHRLRQQVDAILVGAKTIRCDNPQLTARENNQLTDKQPLRIVLTKELNLSDHYQILSTDLPGKTLIFTGKWNHNISLQQKNIEIIILPANDSGYLTITDVLTELGRRQITSVLVEGGMHTHQQFIQANVVNQLQVYVAPVLIGQLNKKVKLENMKLLPSGDDVHLISNDARW